MLFASGEAVSSSGSSFGPLCQRGLMLGIHFLSTLLHPIPRAGLHSVVSLDCPYQKAPTQGASYIVQSFLNSFSLCQITTPCSHCKPLYFRVNDAASIASMVSVSLFLKNPTLDKYFHIIDEHFTVYILY